MSKIEVKIDGHRFEVDLSLSPQCGNNCIAEVNGKTVQLIIPNMDDSPGEMEWIIVDDRAYELALDENLNWIKAYSGLHELEIHDMEAAVTRPRSGDGRIKAPIPGLITRILVQPGDEVKADQPVLVLEAMKMENEVRAPFDGIVDSIQATPGQTVLRNDVLAEVK